MTIPKECLSYGDWKVWEEGGKWHAERTTPLPDIPEPSDVRHTLTASTRQTIEAAIRDQADAVYIARGSRGPVVMT
ncbi:hypothetical protein [Nonomuraea soli]|uniref:Uncharacterized protein n=1 Tax=Nonomuraea soli TaxID=1032476 RepID=A0A7W0CU85_9ACTN|nr:hypothetical protein [Nonomuraea soli]MBA2897411.1 hypothetical protein [Nonomuraea soli]